MLARFFFVTSFGESSKKLRQGMRLKSYRMRSLTVENGKTTFIDLDLEFEGDRAFVIWDSITLGNFLLKARVEIDPKLLQTDAGRGCDYFYHGELILPRPQDN